LDVRNAINNMLFNFLLSFARILSHYLFSISD